MKHAEVLQQIRNSRIGVQQLDSAVAAIVLSLAQFKTETGQHTEKGAVHQQALRKIEHKVGVTLLPQFRNERFEINTRIEIRPPDNLDTGKLFSHQHQQFG